MIVHVFFILAFDAGIFIKAVVEVYVDVIAAVAMTTRIVTFCCLLT